MSDDVVIHYGVKGMRWGVRKDVEGSDKTRRLSLKDPRVKRAAIAGVAITGIVAAAFVASHYNVKLSSINSGTVEKGLAETPRILEQPTDMIYMSKPFRGSGVTRNGMDHTTFRFISEGQTKDYFSVFDNAGLNDADFKPGDFKRLSNGSVATMFADLFGRVDAAGRSVPHTVLIPPDQAVGLNSAEDVIQKYGPELERRYMDHIIQARRDST